MTHDPKIFILLNQRPPEEQPRERLARYGVRNLRTSELIALILRTGSSGKSALDLSDKLLQKYNDDLCRVSQLDLSEIKLHQGFGTASGCALMAAFELGRRVHFSSKKKQSYDLKRVSDVAILFRKEFGAGAPEKFVTFYINRRFRLLGQKMISQGGMSETIVDPRIVFKEALLLDASAVILAHNHPGNALSPSKQDISLTKEMVKAGRIFRIPVAEHVIVGSSGESGIIEHI
jgi:DNA repair protein RadC